MSANSQVNDVAAGASPYGICTPGVLPADQISFVEAVHRQFLQSVTRRFSDGLEKVVSIELVGIEQMPFPEFLSSCDEHACLISLNSDANGGRAILELSSGLLHRTLALLIGAPEGGGRPQRGITAIERHILRECIDNLVLDLRETWASYGLTFQAASIAQDEQPDPAASLPDGGAVVINSVLAMDGSSQGTIRLAVPALLIRIAAIGTNASAAPPAAADRPVLLEALRAAVVKVEAVLGGPSLRMRDLMALAPGQVLIAGPPASCSVACLVNGISKFRGELVSNGPNQAFQIVSPIETRSSRTEPVNAAG